MEDTNLNLYKVSHEYLKFMHEIDSRVSVKYNNRPFVGLIAMVNNISYLLPLTSQTTAERKLTGKNKRAANLTTFVKDSSGKEIANILHNNMFPVKEGVYCLLEVDSEQDTYELNEIRYIRKNKDTIIQKARKLYTARVQFPNDFLLKTCCDFLKLEELYLNF